MAMNDARAAPCSSPAAVQLGSPGHQQRDTDNGAKRLHTMHNASDARGEKPASKKRRTTKKIPKQHRVGNFRSYYNYRLGQQHDGAFEDDPRLSVLQADWFDGKRGLDIGCNSGDLTIAIAKRFKPAYLLGVDVDPQLVSQARGRLKDIMQKQQVEDAYQAIKSSATAEDGRDATAADETVAVENELFAEHTESSESEETRTTPLEPDSTKVKDDMPLSFRLWKAPQQTKGKIPSALGKASLGSGFPYNVIFKREDIAKDVHAGKDYDFVTCFSVTKWIHLFHGDGGIQRVFRKIYDTLAPGGRLILEPQPWKSYHKRKFTSDVTSVNYSKIQLRPKDFPTFLVEQVGFKSCTFLQVCQTSTKGFRRPIYVVEK